MSNSIPVTFLISRTLYWKEMYLHPLTTTFTIFSPSLLFKILFLTFSLFQSSCFSFSYFPSIWLSNLPFPTFSVCPLFSCSSPSVLFFFFLWMYVVRLSVCVRLTFAVGPRELREFRMIERHYFRDQVSKIMIAMEDILSFYILYFRIYLNASSCVYLFIYLFIYLFTN